MEELERWMKQKVEEREVEPNSGLGEAIAYMRKHWEPLTLFLREPGAPLDNNVCERALKKVILHRKNALFYQTDNGARVGDLFMSLIHTAELCDANPSTTSSRCSATPRPRPPAPATGCRGATRRPATASRSWNRRRPPPTPDPISALHRPSARLSHPDAQRPQAGCARLPEGHVLSRIAAWLGENEATITPWWGSRCWRGCCLPGCGPW